MSSPSRQALSRPRQALVDLMRELGFAKITAVQIVGGEPDLTLAIVRRDITLTQDRFEQNVPSDDFQLKRTVVRLFHNFDRLGNAVVEIEIRHGLPVHMRIETALCGRSK